MDLCSLAARSSRDLTNLLTRTDPDSPRVRAMLEGYELHEFAPDQELFSDIVLYTRNSKTAVAPNVNQNITCS